MSKYEKKLTNSNSQFHTCRKCSFKPDLPTDSIMVSLVSSSKFSKNNYLKNNTNQLKNVVMKNVHIGLDLLIFEELLIE